MCVKVCIHLCGRACWYMVVCGHDGGCVDVWSCVRGDIMMCVVVCGTVMACVGGLAGNWL